MPSGSLHLHRSDGEGEWMVKAVDGEVVVTHEHGKGDAGRARHRADLFVFAWHRGMPDTLQIFGDEAVGASVGGAAHHDQPIVA